MVWWPSCFVVCGVVPDRGSNPCSLHWYMDSYHCTTRELPDLPFKQDRTIFRGRAFCGPQELDFHGIYFLWQIMVIITPVFPLIVIKDLVGKVTYLLR